MYKPISYRYLPNADLRTVGLIPLHYLFPIHSVYYNNNNVPIYIHYNGSIFCFFDASSVDISELAPVFKKLPERSSIQIYKYHTPEKDFYYITLTSEIDYNNTIPRSIVDKFSLNPLKQQITAVNERTRNAYSLLDTVLTSLNLHYMDYLKSDLPKVLFEFKKNGNTIQATPVRTNMSYLKIGNRYATLASINNISMIPEVNNILNDHTYLQRIVTIIPSQQRQCDLQKRINENSILIDSLSKKRGYENSISTMGTDVGRVVYTDVTFFLSSDSTTSLNNKFERFNSVMSDNNMALYCHTNTTRSTYISFFPGNDSYGERYSIVFEQSLPNILRSTMRL
jgi:hypothetical protein